MSKWDALYSMAYFTIVVLLLLILLSIRKRLQSLFNPFLRESLHGIMKDTAVLIFLSSLIQLLSYYSFLPESLHTRFDVDLLAIYLAVFALLWLSLGLYNTFCMQKFSDHWWAQEHKVKYCNDLKRDYDELQCALE